MAGKKKYTKKKNVLKKSQIFSKKSAKSQAKQIYYLNKKVNAINRKNRPEIDTMTTDMIFGSFIKPGGEPRKYDNGRIALFKDYLLSDRQVNTHFYMDVDDNVDIIKVRNIQIFGDFGLSELNSYSEDYVTIPNSTINAAPPMVAYLRIYICQTKSGGDDFPSRIFTDIVSDSDDSAFVDSNLISGPLIRGLAKRLKVIRKKIIKVTPNNPRKLYKFKIPGFTYKKVNGGYDSNELFIYYQYVCPCMLQYQNSQGVVTKISPRCHWSMNAKISWNRNPGVEMVTPTNAPQYNPNIEPSE